MIRIYIALGGALAILIALAIFGYHERNLEHTKDATHDTQASVKVEKAADAQTLENQQKAAAAALGAKNAQANVDAYLANHPVDYNDGVAGSMRGSTTASSGCVRQAGGQNAGAKGTSTQPATVRAVLGGGQNAALAEILLSASRMAEIDLEWQKR